MRLLLLISFMLFLFSGANAQDQVNPKSFFSIQIGISNYWNSTFNSNTRKDNIFERSTGNNYYGSNVRGEKINANIQYGSRISNRLSWIAGLSFSTTEKTFVCPCFYCLKIAPPQDVAFGERIYQISVESGLRWIIAQKGKFDFAVDGTTGLRLDIDQNAPVPWFYSVTPIVGFNLTPKHSITARSGLSGQLTGYSEIALTSQLGYQFSF